MKTTSKIWREINKCAPGKVFTFNELDLSRNEYLAAAKALSRMVGAGKLKRVGPGKYYLPEQSPFGELKPEEFELLRPYLFKNGKRIAYITGPTLYNQMGLTTQVPGTIQVACRDKRIAAKVGNLKIKPVKSYVDVTDGNYHVLGLLDALKDFKDIPDSSTESNLMRLLQLLKELNKTNLLELVNAALSYPPRTRALTGALLEWSGVKESLTVSLGKSLNPFSVYYFAIPENILPMAGKWKIK